MKIAVSIPDQVYNSAEKLAKHLRKSRSELYAQAISSYLAKYEEDQVTAKLDEVYASEPSSLESSLIAMESKTVKERW